MLNRISPQSGIHGLEVLESRGKTDVADECCLFGDPKFSWWEYS